MATDLQTAKTKNDYADTLDKLAHSSRDLLRRFRLEVGKLMLEQYFGGSAHAYHYKNPGKDCGFVEFARMCQADLGELGLSVGVAGRCSARPTDRPATATPPLPGPRVEWHPA